MSKLKFNLNRRWIRSRPGSVLILVIALLVLLALIGTAYLSSTQTERYSSVQNSINTEADLLIQGLQTAVSGEIAGGLFAGSNYRPPQQEQPVYVGVNPTYPSLTGYFNYDSATVDSSLASSTVNPPDLFLADRLPINPSGTNPVWNSISWPLFTDSSQNYTFDSPFGQSVTTYLALNKGKIESIPTFTTINGTTYPAMIYYVPAPTAPVALQTNGGTPITIPIGGGYLTSSGPVSGPGAPPLSTVMANPSNPLYQNLINYAVSASGDGIADAGTFKLPVGQINGVTYYGATRVVDGNSAINASSADTQGPDQNMAAGMPTTNFGFFRSNIGFQELLFSGDTLSTLNLSRFPVYGLAPYADVTPSPTNFTWYSLGDEIENQLTRRPGNPGYGATGVSPTWLGQAATAALAYKFSLTNSAGGANSVLESDFPKELVNTAQSTPWSPAQAQQWWNANFYYLGNYNGTNGPAGGPGSPLRTVLVGNNAVSTAVPSQLGNTSAPAVWTAGQKYKFGDWVVDGPAGARRSFVCIQLHSSVLGTGSIAPGNVLVGGNQPEPTPYNASTPNTNANPGAVPFWAGAQSAISTTANARLPGLPWTTVPVKTSVNTATFSQLWLAFCQVMTDSNSINLVPTRDSTGSAAAQAPQWQPPMQPVAVSTLAPPPKLLEQQMGQFRSVIRDPHAEGSRLVLTSAQMLKLRAAIAAVNTLDLRDGDDDVTSRNITLTDDAGNAQYDVEVYGTEKQPYISEVVIQTDGTNTNSTGANYIAVEICNPYSVDITINNWQIGSLNRNSFPTLALGPGLAIPSGLIVPKAVNGVPGLLILEDGTRPTDVNTTITQNQTAYPTATNGQAPTPLIGLLAAASNVGGTFNELFIMRPRLASGTQSKSASPNSDVYDETSPSTNLADYVPVDQMDLTGLTIPLGAGSVPQTTRFLYRRACDASAVTNKPWQFIYPGCYDPMSTNLSGRYFSAVDEKTSAFVPDSTASMPCFLAGPTGGTAAGANSTYNTLPIELNNAFMAGPNPIVPAGNTFPFGGFARNADMLKIPFIGAYRIRPVVEKGSTSQVLTELNSVTMDSALAYDNSGGTDALSTQNAQVTPDADNIANHPAFNEQIGRFCPIGDPTSTVPQTMLDFGPGYDSTVDPTGKKIYWHYHWAKKLFDYLTVQSPQDDYFPNADPTQANSAVTPAIVAKYPGGIIPPPVANTSASYANAQVAGHSEDTTGVEGLININTAPVAVLAQLPFYGGSAIAPAMQPAANAALAQSIVTYRNANGPFQSIFDLYRVMPTGIGTIGFEQANNSLWPTATAAGPQQGVFSPGGIGTANVTPVGAVRYDFQDRFLMLNNISNLITTRSDTFTCYVLLQGWRNVGTGNPTLVVQRRAAFLVDRNRVTPANNTPDVFKIPSN